MTTRRAKNGSNEAFDLKSGGTDHRQITAYYDDWAATYDATLESWNYRTPSDSAEMLLPHLTRGARVLDVGCGTGLFGQALQERGAFHLTGLDISVQSIRKARERGIYAEIVAHNLQSLPLPIEEDSMDAAACVGVLTYIDDAAALLRDICRCLRPGGLVTFTQRTDRWQALGFDKTLSALEAEGSWSVLEITGARDYLPGHADFGDDIKVIHTLCRAR